MISLYTAVSRVGDGDGLRGPATPAPLARRCR